jgi:hypothetical protein
MGTDEHRFNEISERIIGCAYKVSNALGYGFLEKVYEKMRWRLSFGSRGSVFRSRYRSPSNTAIA